MQADAAHGKLAMRSWDDVRRIELFPGVRLGDAVLVVPEAWLPAGAVRRLSFRRLDPSFGGQLAVGETCHAAMRDESVRRALLALWLPRRTGTGIRAYKPASWLQHARRLLRAVAWQVRCRPSRDGNVWRHLTLPDLRAMEDELCLNGGRRADVRNLFRDLRAAGERGILGDYPRWPRAEATPEPGIEASNRGAPLRQAAKREDRSWVPFDDRFVTELLWRALWMQRNLAGQLLDCWSGLKEIAARAASRGRGTAHPAVIAERRRLIAATAWRDAESRPIGRLPFAVSQRVGARFVPTATWPPGDARTVNLLVGVLQALNFATVAFCVGARVSEILSATDDALPDFAAGRLVARTFKLVDAVEGRERDWPLHPAAARALIIQHDLARRVRPAGARHLWVLAGHAGANPFGSPLSNPTEPLVYAVRHLGLTALAGPDRPHAHRWRHTVGRIVCLSVIQAPTVLVDLFGHADVEMTLRYMLSDPRIAEEAVRVAEEAAVALATEAVSDTLAGATEGPAAAPLARGVAWARMRRGETEFGADSLRELAEVLTMSGRQWHLVRPGVICTKGPGEAGPCTRAVGRPDPGACRTTCDHRLETRAAEAECDTAIASLLAEAEAAVADGADLLAEHLCGQVLAQLHRWESVRTRWLARSPLAAALWAGR
ncbi:hypothetical protein ASF53_16845 [Methylobacterium sp. Leaf123]|nr:hypothetical protein ASF53_16845 [Methylobacterium sp. Leaf123]